MRIPGGAGVGGQNVQRGFEGVLVWSVLDVLEPIEARLACFRGFVAIHDELSTAFRKTEVPVVLAQQPTRNHDSTVPKFVIRAEQQLNRSCWSRNFRDPAFVTLSLCL